MLVRVSGVSPALGSGGELRVRLRVARLVAEGERLAPDGVLFHYRGPASREGLRLALAGAWEAVAALWSVPGVRSGPLRELGAPDEGETGAADAVAEALSSGARCWASAIQLQAELCILEAWVEPPRRQWRERDHAVPEAVCVG